MDKQLNYFPSKYNGDYFFDNPKEVETFKYDRFTGQLYKGGMAFKEVKHFNNSCQCILLELHYSNSVSKWKRHFEGDKLILEKQIIGEKEQETEYIYNDLELLEEEKTYSFLEDKKYFIEGIKYFYEFIASKWRVVKKDKFVTGRDGEIIATLKEKYEYDNIGRIKTKISPISIYDSNFDPYGELIISRTYLDSDIIEIEEKYSNKPSSVKRSYYRIIDKLTFYASALQVAKEIVVDKDMKLIINGGSKYSYELDKHCNWIKKFDKGILVEDRRIEY
ncbi:MAG: hypothetical protein ACK4TA_00530 [Saprospiraceae bacterium]